MPEQTENYPHSNVELDADACIVGGGLGGLSLSILLAELGHKVILVEKEKYPFHKVCGEYISLESWPFLERLGVPLSKMDLPVISKLTVTSPSGSAINHPLPLGGFGVSRYTLDSTLAQIARQKGVLVLEDCKVGDVVFLNNRFIVSAGKYRISCSVCTGSFGKRSNLDVKWKRPFTVEKPGKLNNYIGVKYHVKTALPRDAIALHNFENGYCGISRIEDGKYCCCYLTTADNLKKNSNDISQMEQSVLYRNPHLKNIFENMELLYTEPLVISQVSFAKKTNTFQHILMLGDAAGMIAPLCGNGMSMAMHAAKIASGFINQFLEDKCTREQMENAYSEQWNKYFASRLKTGRFIQSLFGKPVMTNMFVNSLKPFPGLINALIRRTHGDPY
jgi:flavin-dependent dehydrogenase